MEIKHRKRGKFAEQSIVKLQGTDANAIIQIQKSSGTLSEPSRRTALQANFLEHNRDILIFAFILTFNFICYADVKIHPDAGKTAASFLKLGIGARAVGMANTFTAVADDVSALYWNPAGLSLVSNKQAGLSHNEYFQGIRHDFAGYVHPLSNGDAFGVSLNGLYTSKDIEARSGGATETSWETQVTPVDYYFMTYDVAAQFSYAHDAGHMSSLTRGLLLGMSMKYIQQTIDNVSAYGLGMDIGAIYEPRRRGVSGLLKDVRFGAAVRNITHYGIKFREKSYILPTDIRLGAYWKKSKKLGFAVDFQQPVDNYLFVSGACEYSPVKFVEIRGGYRYRMYGLELGDITGLSAGLGFNYSNFHIDYSFTPFGVLGVAQRISLTFDFPAPALPKEIRSEKSKETAERPSPSIKKEQVNKQTTAQYETTIPATPAPSAKNKMSSDESYVFSKSSVTCRLIDINLQGMVLYSFSAESESPEVPVVSGKVRQIKTEGLQFEVGESSVPPKFKLGKGEMYYKSVMFRKSFEQDVSPAEVTFKVPRELLPENKIIQVFLCTQNENGGISKSEAEKIGEDTKYMIYKAKLGRLATFAITIK